MLKPQSNQCREVINLDGIWDFKVDHKDEGLSQKWWNSKLDTKLDIAVPSSYNDLFTDIAIREHVGWVWYQREVRVPRGWSNERINVRVDAATHEGIVYINGAEVARHVGGYMPFSADITEHVKAGETFRLTIAVNNVLTNETIPPGEVLTLDTGRKQQTYLHDFYNYSGLHRSVWLYSTPKTAVKDVTVRTNYQGSEGLITYSTEIDGNADVSISIIDEDNQVVATGKGATGEIKVPNVKLWQPGNAYLYKFHVALISEYNN